MPHLSGRSHTLRPFSSHSRVSRELWTFNASSTLGLEMVLVASDGKLQIVRRFLATLVWMTLFVFKFESVFVLIAPTHAGRTCGSLGFRLHGSGGPAFGDIVLPDFGDFFHWVWHHGNAQGLRVSENLSHEINIYWENLLYCSTHQEKCPSDFFTIFVRVGEKQRIWGWPTDFNWNEFPLCLIPTWKLQAITILYIGGASGASSLLTCQESDGNQDASAMFRCHLIIRPSGFVFRVSCSCPFAKKYMKECYVRRLTFYKVQTQPAPIRCILWNCGSFWMYFLWFPADLNHLSGCHDVTLSFPSQEPLPADYTFRSATPAILCTEHTNMKIWVDIIGYVCGFGYAFVIPTFMLYLFHRQRVALRSSRMITASATRDGDLKVFLHEVQGSTTERISRQDRGAVVCQIVVTVYEANLLDVYHGWMKKQVSEVSFIFFHFDHPTVAPGWGIYSSSCCNRSQLHLDSLSWPSCSPPIDRWLCDCHTDWCRKRSESGLGQFGCPCFQRAGIKRCQAWD